MFETNLKSVQFKFLIRCADRAWTCVNIGSAFRGSSALHAVGDSYVLATRPAPQLPTLELRFQFRYAAPQQPRLLELNPQTLWFTSAIGPLQGKAKSIPAAKCKSRT
jgi:hypothetical protein